MPSQKGMVHPMRENSADRADDARQGDGTEELAQSLPIPAKPQGKRGSLATLPAQELQAVLNHAIEEYGRGISVYAIAHGLGVEHTTLYRQLVKHKETEWRDAKVSRALAELEDAEEELKTAPDALALTRARERCRAAQWQLERLMRRIYGQHDAQQALQAIQINLNIAGAAKPENT